MLLRQNIFLIANYFTFNMPCNFVTKIFIEFNITNLDILLYEYMYIYIHIYMLISINICTLNICNNN